MDFMAVISQPWCSIFSSASIASSAIHEMLMWLQQVTLADPCHLPWPLVIGCGCPAGSGYWSLWSSYGRRSEVLAGCWGQFCICWCPDVLQMPGIGSVIKHFLCYWPFVRGIYRSPVDSPPKGQWHWALMFSLMCAWTTGWTNSRDAGDLQCHGAHYDINNVLFSIIVCEGIVKLKCSLISY